MRGLCHEAMRRGCNPIWLVVGLIFFSMSLLSCSGSDSSTAEMWGVYKTSDGTVVRTEGQAFTFSACNQGYRSTATNVELELWKVEFSGDGMLVYDAPGNALIARGSVAGETLSIDSIDGTWSFAGDYRKAGCCFDASDGASTHWHGIRMPNYQDPSSIGQNVCDADYTAWFDAWTNRLYAGSTVIQTQAGPIEYALIGDSGPVVAFTHGGPGSYYSTLAYFSDLLNKGFRALTWSRPGFLRTPLSTGATPEAHADALAALLDALSIDRVAVVGASAGGPPAYQFAIRHPHRTWALVQADGISQAYSVAANPRPGVNTWMYLLNQDSGMWLYNAMFEYANLGTARHFIGMMSTLDDQGNDALASSVASSNAKLDLLGNILLSMAPNKLLKEGSFMDIINYTDMPAMSLEQITAPTLIVHGTADGDVPPEDARYAASLIPGAELYWVHDGIHVVTLSADSDVTFAKILSFLNRHKP